MATMPKFSTELLGFSVLLICLLLPSSLLTCCNSQAADVSVSGSKVESLPGFDGPLPFSLETGYIGVDEGEQVQLFYYFIESENNPEEDPILLWQSGGPFCSAVTALFYEIGPIKIREVEYNGSLPTLILNPHSWTKTASIIFVDMPVDTGFSYSNSPHPTQIGDFKATQHADEFLRKWLIDHPKFKSNPIYLGGDSYAGRVIPLYFVKMLQGNEAGSKPFINLKGYVLGNPVTNRTYDRNLQIPFAHGMGIVSDEHYWALEKSCKGRYYAADPDNEECQKNLRAYVKLLNGIHLGNILHPACDNYVGSRPCKLMEEGFSIFEEQDRLLELKGIDHFSCRDKAYALAKYWANSESVQNALHFRKGSIKQWVRCGKLGNYTKDSLSSIIYHEQLSAKGYRSLIYSGDHDMLIPFIATQAWIRSLNYSIVDDWRQWLVDGQIAGYTRTYSNKMTYATVKGAGHTAPENKPKECAAMFGRWLSGEAL